jgi:hypothetical protein
MKARNGNINLFESNQCNRAGFIEITIHPSSSIIPTKDDKNKNKKSLIFSGV